MIAATREAVFDALADEGKWPLWWGPKGWTNEPEVREWRAGGAWRFVMRGPDGVAHAMEKRLVEIVRPERVVLDHLNGMHTFRMTMAFEWRRVERGWRGGWCLIRMRARGCGG